jgi:chemotaxis protein methyltransferase CheR
MKEINKHITSLLLQSASIDVSKYDDSFLHKSIQKRITATRSGSATTYIALLEQDKAEEVLLIDSLCINYSEFFRNSLTFAVLEHIILPSLLLKKKNNRQKVVRIWSSACAAGQETYSVAMLLEEIKKNTTDEINYRIFATDQSEQQIIKAQKGQYSVDSLNNLDKKRLSQWFIPKGRNYIIKEELKKNIDFSVFDLFNKQLSSPPVSIFGDFDLVICSNLLFYYKTEYRETILNKAGNSMAKGGYLLCGETERDILIKNNYNEVFLQSAIFQKMDQ